jgi:predicted GIY-YIG superfamily endonuclease
MEFSVYGIVDPRTKKLFYIGQTSEFALRCRQHEEGGQTIAGLVLQEIQGVNRHAILTPVRG